MHVYAIRYNAFNVYCRVLAPGTVSLTGDRAQGDDSKHWAYSKSCISLYSKKYLFLSVYKLLKLFLEKLSLYNV